MPGAENIESPNKDAVVKPQSVLVKRHSLSVRVWHWVNAVAVLVLLMSGLAIFNGHPRLYWGEYGSYPDRAWFEIVEEDGRGVTNIAGARLDTTGVLGVAPDADGDDQALAFPHWATIPSYYSLSSARRWHFAFGWIFSIALTLFMLRSLWNRHIQRELHISKSEWSPVHIWRDIKAHARLRFPKGRAALTYNPIQKMIYVFVIFVLLPILIFTGLTMSPGLNAGWPWLLDIFGGRQSARSIHFIAAFALALFFIIHMAMVILSGPIKGLRSMITGRQRIENEEAAGEFTDV